VTVQILRIVLGRSKMLAGVTVKVPPRPCISSTDCALLAFVKMDAPFGSVIFSQ
jgi:hypothetical protein